MAAVVGFSDFTLGSRDLRGFFSLIVSLAVAVTPAVLPEAASLGSLDLRGRRCFGGASAPCMSFTRRALGSAYELGKTPVADEYADAGLPVAKGFLCNTWMVSLL
jgi:hypothetical protein